MADCFASFCGQLKNLLADKKHKRSICLVGIVLIVVILMPGSPDPIPAASSSQPDTGQQEVAKLSHEGAILLPSSETMRDPFAEPPGFGTTKAERVSVNLLANRIPEKMTAASNVQEKKPVNEDIPVLTGIMEDSQTQVAIIRYRGVSRSYRIGQTVGQYQLIGITGKTVIILGSQGERVLQLGR